MLHNELKAKFSWEIMQFCLRLDRSVRIRCYENGIVLDHRCWADIHSTIDTSLRRVLEFLIKKYPPSKHKILDT